MQKFKGYLKVKEVCKLLGVCRDTLRAWEKKGKLVAERNPANNYRYYDPELIENFIKGLDQSDSE